MTVHRKPTALWKKLLLLLVSQLAVLCIGEGVVRLLYPEYGVPVYTTKLFTEFDPKLGWRNVRNFRGQHVQDEYTIVEQLNGKGYRGRELPYDKPAGAYRVLVLGDSFAEGYTVELRDLFSEVMRDKLEHDTRRDIEVINAGTGGYSTDQELMFFEDEGSKYHPDLTVLLFFANDLTFNIKDDYTSKGRGQKPLFALQNGQLTLKSLPKATWNREQVAAGDRAAHSTNDSFAPWRLDSWFLYRLAHHVITAGRDNVADILPSIAQSGSAPGPSAGNGRMQYGNDHTAAEWDMTEALLARLNDRVKTNGGALLLYYVPVKYEMYDDKRQIVSGPSLLESDLGIVAARNGIDFMPTLATFRAAAKVLAPQGKFLYWKKDPHWTAEANHLTGSLLADYIRKHYVH